MKFHSTRNNSQSMTVSEAMKVGLASDGGLFVPDIFKTVNWQSFDQSLTYAKFAAKILSGYFEDDPLLEYLDEICHDTFDFEVPLKKLDEYNFILELFHGPTLSFKDFGARFLANCLSRLKEDKVFTIIVATSGDTGSAVAAAFHQKPNIDVMVLFPEGKISLRQQYQMTCWQDNVLAVSVNGTFDDCQRLVKEAFVSSLWQSEMCLNTANSINIGRLLPQLTYYAYTSWRSYLDTQAQTNFIVPSGNIGHVTACFWAKEMGFPIGEVIIAQNENNIIGEYVDKGVYQPKESIETLANAMDVGKPSNFERLNDMFPEHRDFVSHAKVYCANDKEIKHTIKKVYQQYNEIICPHTATAFYARSNLDQNTPYVIVATAHPAKFEKVIEPILEKEIPPTDSLNKLIKKQHFNVNIGPFLDSLYKVNQVYFKH